jgi:hypothetical protein
MSSCWIFVFTRLSQNCTVTYESRIYKPSCMPFLVMPHTIGHALLYQILTFILAVLTFSACTPPLAEVLLLWDFLLAYGVHMNILAIISQLIILRDEILQHPSYFTSITPPHSLDSITLTNGRPMKLLRKLPPLNSRKVIALSVSFLRKIPQDVYALLASHAWDDSVGTKVDQLHAALD